MSTWKKKEKKSVLMKRATHTQTHTRLLTITKFHANRTSEQNTDSITHTYTATDTANERQSKVMENKSSMKKKRTVYKIQCILYVEVLSHETTLKARSN